jgi:ATP-dependent DNA helicase DinG
LNVQERHASEIVYEIPADTPVRYLSKGGKFIFAVYGCAVLERQTQSGLYVYTAVNVASGERVKFSRRKTQIQPEAYWEAAAKIAGLPICGDSINNAEKRPGEVSLENKLIAVAEHIFAKILPQYGYNLRENQIELTKHMLEVIGCRGITLAESEVGTGKTHAYLISAFLAKRGRLNDFWMRSHYKQQSWAESAHQPVVISTSSIALQKAIVTDYIPELSRILMEHGIIKTPLTAVIRKGKDHYICERRLRAYFDSADKKRNCALSRLPALPLLSTSPTRIRLLLI